MRSVAVAAIGSALAVMLTALAAPAAAAATTVGPGDPSFAYVGRWDRSSSTEYASYWGGAYLKVDFTGTSASLELGAASDILVSIDGAPDVLYAQATGTVSLTPAPLGPGVHTLRVASRYTDDSIRFRGLTLAAGGVASRPAVSTRSIEFIGDSITAGMVNANKALSDYAWLSAERLHAEHTQIAYSGICLIDRPCYSPNSTGMSSQYFMREPVTAATQTPWDFATPQPTAVVVNLGTNDQKFSPAASPSAFQAAYVTFLQSLRARYPAAEIFALRTFNGYYAAQTLNAVDAVGDAHVHYVDTTGWLYPADTVDGTHPSDLAQQKLAARMAATLAPYLYPQNASSTSSAPVVEDFQNVSDWAPGVDGNAAMYTTGTAAVVSVLRNNGLVYGSVGRTFSYDVGANPYLSIRVNGVSNEVGGVPRGQWGLKVNNGAGPDIQLQAATSESGLFTYDLRAVTGWSGVTTFAIRLFVVNDSVEVSALSVHSPLVSAGAVAMASSTKNGNLASAAIDGDPGTRWESQRSDPQWITVDLGRDTTIDEVVVAWETASAKAFELQLSDDNSSWSTLYATTDGPGGTQSIPFTAATGRYVRLYLTERATGWAYSIWDIEVYRHDLAAAAPVQVSSAKNGNLGRFLTDADPGTRWESQKSDPQDIVVDLGAPQAVARVLLRWEAAYASAYQVQVSPDGSTWESVATRTGAAGGTDEIRSIPRRLATCGCR